LGFAAIAHLAGRICVWSGCRAGAVVALIEQCLGKCAVAQLAADRMIRVIPANGDCGLAHAVVRGALRRHFHAVLRCRAEIARIAEMSDFMLFYTALVNTAVDKRLGHIF